MADKSNWYCMLLSLQNLRGIHDIEDYLQTELNKIFGEDLINIKTIGERLTDTTFELVSERYVFFECKNYQNYVPKLLDTEFISLILPNTDNPDPVPYVEIKKFENIAIKKNKKQGISLGDFVLVKDGYLQNLYGIVLKKKNKEKVEVLFRLHTKKFKEILYETNLVVKDNISKLWKHSPSTVAKWSTAKLTKEIETIAKGEEKVEHKIHRQLHRRGIKKSKRNRKHTV